MGTLPMFTALQLCGSDTERDNATQAGMAGL